MLEVINDLKNVQEHHMAMPHPPLPFMGLSGTLLVDDNLVQLGPIK